MSASWSYVAILRALWVKAAPPKGIAVTRAEAPNCSPMLDKVRAKVGGPKAHTVLIAAEFNAAIVQRPRLGVFGWHRNYVVIGLPLLRALSRDEVMAVRRPRIRPFVGAAMARAGNGSIACA